MKINHLPAPTWRWLKVNGTETGYVAGIVPGEVSERIPEGVVRGEGTDKTPNGIPDEVRTGLGPEFDDALTAVPSVVYTIKPNEDNNRKLYQDITYTTISSPDDKGCVNRFAFNCEDGANATVIQFMTGGGDGPVRAALSNKYYVGRGARLTLVQVQNLPEGSETYNDCGGTCEDGGTFRRIQIVLGGGRTYMGDFCDLRGTKSAYDCSVAYYLQGTHLLDMNYVANHQGRRSESNINISGVMADSSSKIFRGTIDFHKGCARSKGGELEDVLLMDDGVINRTVPLILCDEEDVEGSHGASIGRPDDNLVLYLASRALDKDAIYHMMARARVDRVAALIDDEETASRIDGILESAAVPKEMPAESALSLKRH